jgi:hypothetical protein
MDGEKRWVVGWVSEERMGSTWRDGWVDERVDG